MAKTGLLLKGARGKLAGMVLMKGERGTVMRENVVPANPRTNKQMLQRVAFATVTSAAKHLLPIIGQTYQGETSEKYNRRAFVRTNVNRLKNYFMRSLSESNIPCAAIAKGVSIVVPNNYQVAAGSATPSSLFTIRQVIEGGDASIEGLGAPAARTLDYETYTAKDVLGWFDVYPGLQVTYLLVYNSVSQTNFAYSTENDALRYSRFGATRMVFKDDITEAGSFTVSAQTSADDIINYVKENLIDKDKTDPILLNAFTDEFMRVNPVQGEEQVELTFPGNFSNKLLTDGTLEADYLPQGWGLIGVAVIDSYWGGSEWHYSNSFMCVSKQMSATPQEDPAAYGLNIDNAIASFMTAGKTSASDLYTRQGGDEDTLGF